jgi:S1-C subfamily serine protease
MINLGRAIYPWLGVVAYIDLEPRAAAQIGLPQVRGVLITQLGQQSPAAQAGLRGGNRFATYRGLPLRSRDGRPIVLGGDIILAVDGVKTPTFYKYRNVILQKKVGQNVQVTYLRDNNQFTTDITLTADPRIR